MIHYHDSSLKVNKVCNVLRSLVTFLCDIVLSLIDLRYFHLIMIRGIIKLYCGLFTFFSALERNVELNNFCAFITGLVLAIILKT